MALTAWGRARTTNSQLEDDGVAPIVDTEQEGGVGLLATPRLVAGDGFEPRGVVLAAR